MSCTKRYSVLILFSLSLLLPSCNSIECSIKIPEEKRDPLLGDRIEKALDRLVAVMTTNKLITKDYSTIIYNVNPTPAPNHVHVLGWCSITESADRCSYCIVYLVGRMKKEQCPLKASNRLIQGLTCVVRYEVGEQTVDRDDAPDLDFRVFQSLIRVPSHYWEYFNSAVGKEMRLQVETVPLKWERYFVRDLEIQLHRNAILKSVGQCPRNLSTFACLSCMEDAMEVILKDCHGLDACGVVSSSCSLKYSTITW